MSQQLTVTQRNRDTLATTLKQEQDYVTTVIPIEKVDDFKNNYLELSQNTYLMEKIPPKEILVTAVNATALGLNVNPIYKEAYILPFNVKGRGMVASIVVSKDGHVQMAFQAGFFLRIDNVWSINGNVKNESEMTKAELMLLKVTDLAFVKEHLIGWDISLEDISDESPKVPLQSKFIGLEYVLEVTKQLQTPEHSIQTWVHKAVRRAMGDMFIPRHRKSLMMEKLDEWNNNHVRETEVIEDDKPVVDPLANISQSTQEDATEAEIVEEEVTVKTIQALYVTADAEMKAKIAEVMGKHSEWKTYSQDNLISLHAEIKAL